MAIDTTVSLNNSTIKILEYLSKTYKISKSKIITKTIVILSSKNQFYRSRILTEYQSFDGDNFKRLHLYLSEADFNLVFDFRHFFRASFSLLIAEVLAQCFDELVDLIKETDNYLCKCHVKIYHTQNNVRIWKHYWGIPPIEEIPLE